MSGFSESSVNTLILGPFDTELCVISGLCGSFTIVYKGKTFTGI